MQQAIEFLEDCPDVFLLKRYVPRKRICGVYFLFYKGGIVYIGKSVNVLDRIPAHIFDKRKAFDEFTYIEFEEPDLTRKERYFIDKFLPKYNRDSVTRKLKVSKGIIMFFNDKDRLTNQQRLKLI